MSLAWSETEFNWRLRAAFQAQGYNARHVRETDLPGFPDLLLWKGRHEIRFVELKLIHTQVQAAQREFMREAWNEGANSYWAVYDQGKIYWQPGFFMPQTHDDWFEHATEGLIQAFCPDTPASSFVDVFKFFNTRYGALNHGQ